MKTAAVDIHGAVLADCAGILSDAGLEIIGSLMSPQSGAVRLLVRGEVLPEDCAIGPLHLLKVTVATESYGRQRLCRLLDLTLCGRVLPPERRN